MDHIELLATSPGLVLSVLSHAEEEESPHLNEMYIFCLGVSNMVKVKKGVKQELVGTSFALLHMK